jgi:hypothetical protein
MAMVGPISMRSVLSAPELHGGQPLLFCSFPALAVVMLVRRTTLADSAQLAMPRAVGWRGRCGSAAAAFGWRAGWPAG